MILTPVINSLVYNYFTLIFLKTSLKFELILSV